MNRQLIQPGVFLAGLALGAFVPDSPAQVAGDELGLHLATLKRQVEDPSLDIGRRESLVLELAGTLDRAAQSAKNLEKRLEHWSRAIELLDDFSKKNPGHPRERELRLQAAVYRWAQAQGSGLLDRLSPGNEAARKKTVSALDDAIHRLRGITIEPTSESLSDNIRFRLARALADRAELEPLDSLLRGKYETEALEVLKPPVKEPGLTGFWRLLNAELLRRNGQLDAATAEIQSAQNADPPPSEPEVLDIRIPLLIAQKKFAEAAAAISGSHEDAPSKDLRYVRLYLAEIVGLAPGDERFRVESELFQRIKAVRKTKGPEARLALLELARSGLEPDPKQEPEVWDALAEAYEIQGNPIKAGALEERAAERAENRGLQETAAQYRLRGGGYLFQAGRYLEADAMLSRVVDNPHAGAVRPKAGMLRGLARGRALAAGLPGMTTPAYSAALEQQIRDFPDDPSTGEARWLLGALARASGENDRAETLWTAITPGTPRWIDARLAVAELQRDRLDRRLLTADRQRIRDTYTSAQNFLVDSVRDAKTETEEIELLLAQARLNVTPQEGNAQIARTLAERVGRMTATAVQRYRARLIRIIALAQLGRYVEAEQEAQSHPSWAETSARTSLFDTVHSLDQSASLSEIDLHQRRYGLIMRLLLEPLLGDRGRDRDGNRAELSPDQRAELEMRRTRALLFLGDDRGARESFGSWAGSPRTSDDNLLRDLADTYNRLEAYEMAIEVERLRARNASSGSPTWFDARYGLALAYYHSGRREEAAKLIDAAAILHPDLGGGVLQSKFIRLRQRIGPAPVR